MLNTLIIIGISLTAILHFWFFILETFLWQKKLGMKVFKLEREFAKKSAALAANQGIYNAFLAAGLLWSLIANNPEALHLKVFFLGCVVVAGIFGGITVSIRILFFQTLPAALALMLVAIAYLT